MQGLIGSAVLAGRGVELVGERHELGDTDGPRATLLNPHRPARDLLDMLTDLVRECFETYVEHCDPGDVGAGDGGWIDLVRDRFDAEVRAEAARTVDRLHVSR